MDAVLTCAQDKAPNDVTVWLHKANDREVKFEDLQKPGEKHRTLDRRLAAALTKTLPSEFGRMIEVKRTKGIHEGKLLSGR